MDAIQQSLQQLIADQGKDVFNNPKRFEALLRDYLGDKKKEIKILLASVEENIPDGLLNYSRSTPVEIVIGTLSQRLVANIGYTPDLAKWAVESWALSLGVITITSTVSSPLQNSHQTININRGDKDFIAREPLEIASGKFVSKIMDLPAICDNNWQAAIRLFKNGKILAFLIENIHWLRVNDQNALAEHLERMIPKIQNYHNQAISSDEITCNLAFEKTLELFENVEIPQFSLEGDFNFGVCLPNQMLNKKITIKNIGRGYLCGGVTDNSAWLQITPKRFGIYAGSKVDLTLTANTGFLTGSPQGIKYQSEIELSTNSRNIKFSSEIMVCSPQFEISPLNIPFGEIGEQSTQLKAIFIKNSSNISLPCTATSLSNWLSIDKNNFVIPPYDVGEVNLAVQSSRLEKEQTHGVVRISIFEDITNIEVTAKRPTPKLKLMTRMLDFGSVGPNNVMTKYLVLQNIGTTSLSGNLTSEQYWLSFSEKFDCAPGMQEIIPIEVSTANMKFLATYKGRVNIQSNGGSDSCDISATFEKPVLKLENNEKDFGYVFDKNESQLFGRTHLFNDGGVKLIATLSPAKEWLVVEPLNLEIAAKEGAWVKLTIDKSRLAKGINICTLKIVSNGGNKTIDIKCIGPTPQLKLSTKHVTFGELGWREELAKKIKIENTGTDTLVGTLSTDSSWLEVPPEFTCEAGEKINVKIIASTSKLPLPDTYSGNILVNSNGGHHLLTASLKYQRPTIGNVRFDPSSITLDVPHPSQIIKTILTLHNTNEQQFFGTTSTAEHWVELTPKTFSILPDTVCSIEVFVNLKKVGFQHFTISRSAKITIIDSFGDSQSVDLRVINPFKSKA